MRIKFLVLLGILLILSGCGSITNNDTLPANVNYNDHQLWDRVRSNFRLEHHLLKSRVREQIQWFANHKPTTIHMLGNAAPYIYYVHEEVLKRNLPGELALLPVIESAYNPHAYSHHGAAGLWQLMPKTATGYGIKQNWWFDGRRDIYASTNAALYHLGYLYRFFKGNWDLAIAAYDAGQGTIANAMNANKRRGISASYWNLSLTKEAMIYVPRLLALAAIVERPKRYGFALPAIKDSQYFDRINVDKPVNLPQAAKLAGITQKELYRLNPGFNRWTSDPREPYRLVLPVDSIDQFKTQLALVKIEKEHHQPLFAVASTTYTVKKGDTLYSIARNNHITTASLMRLNNLKKPALHLGQRINLPKTHKSILVFKTHNKKNNFGRKKSTSVYVVKTGDTIYKIARKNQISVAALKKLNKINAKSLKAGQALNIPASDV